MATPMCCSRADAGLLVGGKFPHAVRYDCTRVLVEPFCQSARVVPLTVDEHAAAARNGGILDRVFLCRIQVLAVVGGDVHFTQLSGSGCLHPPEPLLGVLAKFPPRGISVDPILLPQHVLLLLTELLIFLPPHLPALFHVFFKIFISTLPPQPYPPRYPPRKPGEVLRNAVGGALKLYRGGGGGVGLANGGGVVAGAVSVRHATRIACERK